MAIASTELVSLFLLNFIHLTSNIEYVQFEPKRKQIKQSGTPIDKTLVEVKKDTFGVRTDPQLMEEGTL